MYRQTCCSGQPLKHTDMRFFLRRRAEYGSVCRHGTALLVATGSGWLSAGHHIDEFQH
jgi:hypothetical protein